METLSTAIGLSSYRDAIVYGVLIVILWFAQRVSSVKCEREGVRHEENLKVNLSLVWSYHWALPILKGLELSGIMNLYYIQILMGIGISILMGLGTNWFLVSQGNLHLGQAGFMAIGAYSSAIITGMMPTYDRFLPLNGCRCHHRSYCCPYLWSTYPSFER